MTANQIRNAAVVLLATAALACGGGAAERDPGTSVQRSTASNGSSLNGSSLNGSSLNGSSLNGSSLNGVSLNGSSLNGVQLDNLKIESTALAGNEIAITAKNHRVLRGSSIVGAIFKGILSDGSTLPVRIDSAEVSSSDAEIWHYGVSYETSEGWKPLCGSSSVPALALSGYWDATAAHVADAGVITFACRGLGATAKCVELGYKPWKNIPGSSSSLRGHHQACTRMIRADYCGDGQSHTVDGRAVNLYDAVGIQADTESWLFEAEWKAGGARCISPLVNDRYVKAGLVPPSCFLSIVSLSCGAMSHFSSGTLVMNETEAL